MNKKNFKIDFFLILIFFIPVFTVHKSFAQGGGPPMLTDDPGTPGSNRWEINASFNSHIAKLNEFEAPLIDVNYGWKKRTQLKIEMPYLIAETADKNFSGNAGSPLVGIKYRFIDEDSNFISVSCYPQGLIRIHTDDENEIKLPVQLEKSFGRLVVGEEIGFLHENNTDYLINGTLLGYRFSEKFETMGEIYFGKSTEQKKSTSGFINFGLRYELSKKFVFLSSFGTQIMTRKNEERENFFSFIGLQLYIFTSHI